MAVLGKVPCKINGIFDATIKNLNVDVKTPQTVHKGPIGVIGIGQGVPDVTSGFQVCIPETGPVIDLEKLSAGDGFFITYSLGAKKYRLVGCHVNSDGLKVDNGAGNVTIDYGITCERRLTQ